MTELPQPAAGGDDPESASAEGRQQPAAPGGPQSSQHSGSGGSDPQDPAPASQKPADPPWSLQDLFIFILFAGAAVLSLLMIAGILFGMLKARLGWTMQPQAALGRIPVLLGIQLALEALCFLFIYFLITQKYQRPFWKAIHWFHRGGQAVPAVVIGIVLAVALQWFSDLSPPSKRLPVENWFSTAASAYAVALMGIVVAPFVEELVFRGFFYPVFESRWGLPAAVVITSILFAILHGSQLGWSWKEISAIFAVGLVLTYARGRTGSLLPPYLMHVAYNSTLFLSLYISTSRFHNLPG